MVESLDTSVGRVVDALKAAGQLNNTIIIFMSDNGGLSTSEGSPTSNMPLRAGKGWLNEGGIREPMFVVWPGTTEPNSVCSSPIISTDFYPTILEMTGLPARPRQHVDGISFVPALRGKALNEERPIFWHHPHYGNQGDVPGGAVRIGKWKLIERFEKMDVTLFNIVADPGEHNDLARSQPKITARLRGVLHDWRKTVDARMPTQNPKFDAKKKRRRRK
jgi:arylsulfatase A-like enzyme